MFDIFSGLSPEAQLGVMGLIGVVILLLLGFLWRRLRESLDSAARRRNSRQRATELQEREAENARLAEKIIATSSTSTIAGFEIVQQIEAVFIEGEKTPTAAVSAIKAQAARKGANGMINLQAARLPSGKCVANGDAVIVRRQG